MTDSKGLAETFLDFGFNEGILKGIKEAGFRMPSPVQQRAIPVVMAGSDVVAQAQTGTGKTAAFGLPTMNNIDTRSGVQLLVIVPTRELAEQVSEELYRLGNFAGMRTVAVYGGQSIGRQVEMIHRGAQVVVATPGRLLDHLRSKRLRRFSPSIVVLDEADEMLDMGFLEDIEAIFSYLPDERQTLLFSATMPAPIRSLAKKILKSPTYIDITPKGSVTNEDVSQRYYVIHEREREEAMARLIDTESPSKSIVFCRTKREADNLSTTLVSRGYSAKALHGDMDQRARNDTIAIFKRGKADMLVATDVAARGLDISDVSHVFNYHIPFDPQSYIHRIGRTGRAGKKGIAITLVTPLEFKELSRIMKVSGATIKYEEMPSIHEVKKNYIEELAEKVGEHEIYDDAAELLANFLAMGEDPAEIAVKALSALMDKRQVAGPNKIGLNADEAQRMLQRSIRSGGGGGKGRYHKGRSGGGRPGGRSGGGGYRSGGGRQGQGGNRGGRRK